MAVGLFPDRTISEAIKTKQCDNLIFQEDANSKVALAPLDTWYTIKTITLAAGDLQETHYQFIRIRVQFTGFIDTGAGGDAKTRVLVNDVQVGQDITELDAAGTEGTYIIDAVVDPKIENVVKIQMYEEDEGNANGNVKDVFITGKIMEVLV